MTLQIRLLEPTLPVDPAAYATGSSALNLAGAPEVFLRFAIQADDPEELEALRHARRSMLREEWTRGRDGDEPSLEEAIFSSSDILWWIRPERRRWYLQSVEELAARANRHLSEREHS